MPEDQLQELELGKPASQLEAITKTTRRKPEPKERPKFEFKVPIERYAMVIGLRRAKVAMHKLLELPLMKPEAFEKLKLKKSCGIIMYGAPGIGKTFLAKAVNGELGVKLCYVPPSSILSKYVGESSHNVKILFDVARRQQPCCIFIDECETLLQNRDNVSSEGGSQELKSAISEFLIEVSKVHDDKTSHIYLIGATNQIWNVDVAHKRSGRFEYILYLRPPSFNDRRKLFKLYLEKGKQQAPEYFKHINYSLLAISTMYYSPADIERLCDVAIRNAIEKRNIMITTRTVQKALWSSNAGKSSLDPWFLSMAIKYLPQKKSKLRWLISKSYRQKELKDPKLDKADLEMVKDMVKDIRSYMRWHWGIHLIRIFGKGFPSFT